MSLCAAYLFHLGPMHDVIRPCRIPRSLEKLVWQYMLEWIFCRGYGINVVREAALVPEMHPYLRKFQMRLAEHPVVEETFDLNTLNSKHPGNLCTLLYCRGFLLVRFED